MLSEAAVAVYQRMHQPMPNPEPGQSDGDAQLCRCCQEPWPCDAGTLLADRAALVAQVPELRVALQMLVDWEDLTVGMFAGKYGSDDSKVIWGRARRVLAAVRSEAD